MIAIRTGMRVRITHLTDVIGVDEHAAAAMTEREQDSLHKAMIHALRKGTFEPAWPNKILTPAGTVVEGIVMDDDGGFFNLRLENGDSIGYYDGDDTIRIEVITA
jgi:hypothetical protein